MSKLHLLIFVACCYLSLSSVNCGSNNVLENSLDIAAMSDCDGERICQVSCSVVLSDYKCKSHDSRISRFNIKKVDDQIYFKPPFSVDLGLPSGSQEIVQNIYDLACIYNSNERSDLHKIVYDLKESLKTRNPNLFPIVNILSDNAEFMNFWVNLREFCKQVYDGYYPKDRVINSFLTKKSQFSAELQQSLHALWQTDSLVSVRKNGIATLTKVPKFIFQLAGWVISDNMVRCGCSDIEQLALTGNAPNGRTILTKENLVITKPLSKLYYKQQRTECLKKFANECRPIEKFGKVVVFTSRQAYKKYLKNIKKQKYALLKYQNQIKTSKAKRQRRKIQETAMPEKIKEKEQKKEEGNKLQLNVSAFLEKETKKNTLSVNGLLNVKRNKKSNPETK